MLIDGSHPAREFTGICCKPLPKERRRAAQIKEHGPAKASRANVGLGFGSPLTLEEITHWNAVTPPVDAQGTGANAAARPRRISRSIPPALPEIAASNRYQSVICASACLLDQATSRTISAFMGR